MEGRSVLHVRRASLLRMVPNNANNGQSKYIYTHTHAHTQFLESFNVMKGKWLVWVAVLRLTTGQLL